MILQPGSDEFKWQVGKILARARKDKKFTQQDVAAVAGIVPSAVAQFESGECTPSLVIFLRLAAFLELNVKELIGCLRYDVRKTKPAAGPKASLDPTREDHYDTQVGVWDDSSAYKSMG